MHQPDYRDSSGIMQMPWVFLHATKDYLEMPWLLSRFSKLRASFNLSASLMEQLELYDEPLKNDYFLNICNMHPSRLSEKEKAFIIKIAHASQFETMVRPLKRYEELYGLKYYSDDELIDLEMMLLLAWSGNYLRTHNSVVKELLTKGRNFTQNDKENLISSLCAFVKTIIPYYRTMQDRGVISVTTTPYYHPILPLLIDMENAIISNPHTTLPQRPISLASDARVHIEKSLELYKKHFKKAPVGFWPAEGGVDSASVELYREYGIKYIATDEAILFKSIGSDDRANLYKQYNHNGVRMFFRDHTLSDLIGFTYRYKNPFDAAHHFMGSLENIYKSNPNAHVSVILDGENAWEFFENNAYEFFNALYERLESSSWCDTLMLDDVAMLESVAIEKLHPGSWIYGTFDTWSGHSEKNRAWELIYQTYRDVVRFLDSNHPAIAEVKEHFLQAECSDWFWWYGDDHISDFAKEFDELFRSHLIAIYELLDLAVPTNLYVPIISDIPNALIHTKPKSPVSPKIDGYHTSFFEWMGSGVIDERKLYSTMDRVRGPVDIIYYGHNKTAFYAAFDGEFRGIDKKGLKLRVTIEELERVIEYDLENPKSDNDDLVALEERLELALSRVHFDNLRKLHLRFELSRGMDIIQILPGNGSLEVDLDVHYATNWFV